MTRIPDFAAIPFAEAGAAASGGGDAWLTPEDILVKPVHTEQLVAMLRNWVVR